MGFDWFVATIFLLHSGNRDKAWNLLQKCFCILSSGYLSMARLHASVSLICVLFYVSYLSILLMVFCSRVKRARPTGVSGSNWYGSAPTDFFVFILFDIMKYHYGGARLARRKAR